MTQSIRLLTRLLVAPLVLAAFVSAASAAATFGVRAPSITGSYLAGQQALVDLKTSEAAKYFRQASELDWDNPLVIERAFIAYAADGQVEQSSVTAQHLLELDPGNELARLVVATQAVKEGRYDAAIAELDQLGTDNFAGITGAILRGWAEVGAGRYDGASAMLDELGKDGLDEFLVFHRAMMAEVAGYQDEAIGYASRAYEADPLVERVAEAYARLLGNAGRFEEATAVAANFEAEGLTHPLMQIVSDALSDQRAPGMFADSVQTGAAEMYHGIGVALARDGSIDLAVVFLQLGLYLEPRADVMAMALGQLFDISSQHDIANAIYDGIPATSPMKATAVVRVAQNLDAVGDRPEAIRRLGNIVATNPGDVDAVSVLGDLLRYDEQYGEAADAYTRALAIEEGDRPSDWRFYYVRGIAHERDGQWAKAEADFLRALELNPDQPQVLNYLGYSWVDQGMNLQPALEMIQKAVQAAPNDGYIVDSLGWAFYRLGRIDEAVAVLEQAVQLMPNDPEINDHLGDAYWKAGRVLEARFQWTVAASVDEPDGVVRIRVAPKLANGLDPTAATQ